MPEPLTPATLDDAAVAAQWVGTAEDVLVFAGPRMRYPLTASALLDPGPEGWTCFVLRNAGSPVAIGSVRRVDAGTARIGRVLVNPEGRGQGHGRRVMELLIAEAFRLPGVRAITLGVWASNTGARALYRSLGFVDVATRTTPMGDQEWMSHEMALGVN